MDAQNPPVSTPTPAPTVTVASPGFVDLAKASFQFLRQFWLSYFKLAFLLAIPAVVGFLVIGFFFFSSFLQSALGFGGFEAHAAPAIPSKPQVVEESAAPAADGTAPDAMVPPEPVPTPDSSAEPDVVSPIGSEPTTPEVAPESEGGKSTFWGNPEGAGPTAVGNDTTGDSVSPLDFGSSTVGNPTSQFSGILALLGMGGFVVLPLVLGLLAVLYQLIVMLSLTRLTIVLERGETAGAMPVIKWAIKNSGTYLSLVFRIFIYSTLWIPMVAMLVYSVLTFLASAGIAIPGMTWISFIIGLASLISIPLAFLRTPRTLFAHFVLADRECGSKEALQHSVEISIGHWWQIVLYLIGIGFVSSLASGILSSVIGKINGIAGLLVSIVLSVAIAFYMVIFNFGLFRMLEAQFKPQK